LRDLLPGMQGLVPLSIRVFGTSQHHILYQQGTIQPLASRS
jgi:hypothetical protein